MSALTSGCLCVVRIVGHEEDMQPLSGCPIEYKSTKRAASRCPASIRVRRGQRLRQPNGSHWCGGNRHTTLRVRCKYKTRASERARLRSDVFPRPAEGVRDRSGGDLESEGRNRNHDDRHCAGHRLVPDYPGFLTMNVGSPARVAKSLARHGCLKGFLTAAN